MHDEKPSQQNEERPRLKITDRRKFSPDGTPRPAGDEATSTAAADEPEATPKPPVATGPVSAPEPVTGKGTEPTKQPAADVESARTDDKRAAATTPSDRLGAADEEPPVAGAQAGISDLPRDFAALVEGMYFEAMLYMGAIPDPRTGQVMNDLEIAKYKIDLLTMLEAKTEGNLTPEEHAQLEEALYQLRMAFIQASKSAKH